MDDKLPTKAAKITSLENLCVYGMQVCICVSAHMHVCMYVFYTSTLYWENFHESMWIFKSAY